MSAVSSANSLYQQLASESQTASTNSSSNSNSLANESTFLQLLVAQLKNQDPTQPVDGTTFVTQLAQFSDLEQNLAMRQDLDSMSLKYDGSDSTTPASSSTTAASSTTSSDGSGTSGTNGSQSN